MELRSADRYVFVCGTIQAEVFTTGLGDTSHTLTVEVTGEQNAASTSLSSCRRFRGDDVWNAPQDTDPAIAYGPDWIQDNRTSYSEGASAESHIVGAQATITFTGTGIRWIAPADPVRIARIFVDGAFVGTSIRTSRPKDPAYDSSEAVWLPGAYLVLIQVMGSSVWKLRIEVLDEGSIHEDAGDPALGSAAPIQRIPFR